MNFTQEQKQIITTNHSKVVVLASAASGKTATLTARVHFLLEQGIDPSKIVVITFTNMAAEELYSRLERPKGLFVGTIHAYANYLLLSSGISTREILDKEEFDKLFNRVKENLYCIRPVEHLLLDEAQDSDSLQFEFLLDMVKPQNFMLVGDWRQCQPTGTKILLRDGIIKNIEDIQIGDEIVWYDSLNGRCCGLSSKSYNSIHKYVTNIESREFLNDELITITNEQGDKSTYTPNHRTFVKMRDDTPYEHCVYLMCDDNYRFRIGKIALRGTKTKNGNPWREKMYAEGCSKIWILKVFKTDKEARLLEQKLSYKYSIPQICWQTNKVLWTENDIDYIYEGLNTYNSAKNCLKEYHRNIDYPLFDKNIDWLYTQKFASNATTQIYAVNIMHEVMDCVVYDNNSNNHSRKKFLHIINETRNYIDKPIKVYSLQVDGGTYVADNIITHNSIYRWKGSEPELVMNMVQQPDITTYPLTENYRNGASILNYAKRIIAKNGEEYEDYSYAARQVPGQVIEIPFASQSISNLLLKDRDFGKWFVLTRTNTEIELMMRSFTKNKIPFDTFKKSQLDSNLLLKKLNENTVKLITIHTAKGLEADKVVVIGANFYNVEERCISYVAATRARNLLVWTTKRKGWLKQEQWE